MKLKKLFFKQFSSKTESKDNELLFTRNGYVANIVINRPNKLNSLNSNIFKLLSKNVESLNFHNNARLVILKGQGNKAFSSGGDIKECRKYLMDRDKLSAMDFKFSEFKADADLASLKPNLITIFNGYTIGAAVGLTYFSKIKIATESTVLSLPEARIGFCIDAGTSFFCPKMKGQIGKYMTLTGKQLVGRDVVSAGFATHFITNDKIAKLEDSLLHETIFETTLEETLSLVESFSGKEELSLDTLPHSKEIEKCFSHETFEELWSYLEENSSKNDFISSVFKDMKGLSPISIRVIFEQFKRAKKLSLEECYNFESKLADKFFEKSDFIDSVRAYLIDKDNNPKLLFKNAMEIPQEAIDWYFDFI